MGNGSNRFRKQQLYPHADDKIAGAWHEDKGSNNSCVFFGQNQVEEQISKLFELFSGSGKDEEEDREMLTMTMYMLWQILWSTNSTQMSFINDFIIYG
jgi:hypothetical protein